MEVTCPPMPGAASRGAYVIRVSNERNVDYISISGVLVYQYAPDCFQCSEDVNPDENPDDVVIAKVRTLDVELNESATYSFTGKKQSSILLSRKQRYLKLN